jgi:hypothetical protein
MFGRLSLPDNLPRLNSYQAALSRYDNTVPLRTGKDAGLVPLGDNRRYKRSQMLKVESNFGKAIICRYWVHNVITFYADGRVHIDTGHWHTPTTLMFLNDVYGAFTRYKGKIYYQHNEGHYYINPVEGLWLNPDGSPKDPLPEYAHELNRAKWKAIIKRFEPFTTYAQDMMRVSEPKSALELVNEFNKLVESYGAEYWRGLTSVVGKHMRIPYITISPKEIKYNRGKIVETRREFVRRIATACERASLDEMYPLMYTLQTCASESVWTGNNYTSECSPERIKKYFYELLKFEYCNEVFDEREQPIGNFVADSNAKYFTTPTK